MPANYQAELTGVLGQPVAENPTGVMQEAAFAAAGLNWRYLTIEVPANRLEEAMRGVRAFGMRGINLTIPHKVAVIPHLDELSPAAKLIGAVNTVCRQGDRLIGENTDGKGFLRGLMQDAACDPKGKKVVVLGAGGAARAITAELLLAGASVSIVNRSRDRVETMAANLASRTGFDVPFEIRDGSYIVPEDIDVLVNATPIGLYPNTTAMPSIVLDSAKPELLVADAVFNPPVTALLAYAKGLGFPTLDGLSMLVYQGAIGFELWTGLSAPEDVMRDALKKALTEDS